MMTRSGVVSGASAGAAGGGPPGIMGTGMRAIGGPGGRSASGSSGSSKCKGDISCLRRCIDGGLAPSSGESSGSSAWASFVPLPALPEPAPPTVAETGITGCRLFWIAASVALSCARVCAPETKRFQSSSPTAFMASARCLEAAASCDRVSASTVSDAAARRDAAAWSSAARWHRHQTVIGADRPPPVTLQTHTRRLRCGFGWP
jgi:hypothetical protein